MYSLKLKKGKEEEKKKWGLYRWNNICFTAFDTIIFIPLLELNMAAHGPVPGQKEKKQGWRKAWQDTLSPAVFHCAYAAGVTGLPQCRSQT